MSNWTERLLERYLHKTDWFIGFWGNTEWLEARVRAILEDEEWLSWLLKTTNVGRGEQDRGLDAHASNKT